MYPITQGSVYKRTQQAASRLHDLSEVQPLLLQLFVVQVSSFMRTCRTLEGVKRMRFTVDSRCTRTTGSGKNEADRFQKENERLHVGKERKKWVRNPFLSVPFRKRTIGPYGPFFERNG